MAEDSISMELEAQAVIVANIQAVMARVGVEAGDQSIFQGLSACPAFLSILPSLVEALGTQVIPHSLVYVYSAYLTMWVEHRAHSFRLIPPPPPTSFLHPKTPPPDST
ncbi:hypothetical protein KIPB_004584 [Kipferlia bialata]|uniref:Uncharacterized protein n=1 Tax=Kipferlia bialata TaxID=797122 RepID=A0A391NQY4_9EUKA|nr:hypothetical protein KIPB_004584 [Kipferlia bialata]|eukprot:g4584.t1